MTANPELLYLLSSDPGDFAQVVSGMQPADVAEALNDLPPAAAARVVEALPFDRRPASRRARAGAHGGHHPGAAR